ncbi:hypothetical protein AJ80_01411 [Polytolypa hystricis UAMH7299]|uniref:F-box domain-containing protein n=1 Tax=Polytolypa hystricis (strain UAMH7299) TaxID=1447883 RepID=A0A2B7Z0I4_POLH7|nr:hypothetical protein AJ80_01411 [Polytolypa hystricis UAMH7299]
MMTRSRKRKSMGEYPKPSSTHQDRQIDPQSGSPFFRLPSELRNQIYMILFSSTRLTFTEKNPPRTRSGRAQLEPRKLFAPKNSLAILRSCQRIHEETKFLWLSNIELSFDYVEDLMDKLTTLPQSILGQIRFLRTGARPARSSSFYERRMSLQVIWGLRGLRLDTLTLLAGTGPETAYDVDGFIWRGKGSKEFHFISHSSEILAFSPDDDDDLGPPMYRRKPQPATWHNNLLRRDGQDSGASVVIYRSTLPGVQGSVLNPRTREPFRQTVSSLEQLDNFGLTEDQELLGPDEKSKEVLIVVKRGRGADINESDTRRPKDDSHNLAEWQHFKMRAMIED